MEYSSNNSAPVIVFLSPCLCFSFLSKTNKKLYPALCFIGITGHSVRDLTPSHCDPFHDLGYIINIPECH